MDTAHRAVKLTVRLSPAVAEAMRVLARAQDRSLNGVIGQELPAYEATQREKRARKGQP